MKSLYCGIRTLSFAVAFFSLAAPAPSASLKGTLVDHPERITGLWEADDGLGGAVGLNLQLTTKVKSLAKTLVGTPQYWESLMIGVYQRGSERHMGDANWLMADSAGVSWDGKHLVADFPSARPAIFPVIHLNLNYDRLKQIWSGWFERGAFAKQVILRRLKAGPGMSPSPLVGTWLDGRPEYARCMHIVEQSDGKLAGWYDTLSLPGLMRYANGIVPLNEANEHYGQQAIVTTLERHELSFQINAYGGLCCSPSFYGRPSPDGRQITGAWEGGNAPGSHEWRRVEGNSCAH